MRGLDPARLERPNLLPPHPEFVERDDLVNGVTFLSMS
jgi:hypothetical protein